MNPKKSQHIKVDSPLNTGILRITRTNSAAFFLALGGLLFCAAVVGAFLVVQFADGGPWLTPEGKKRSMAEVYLFVAQLAALPLLMTFPFWARVVWGWKSILRDYQEVPGRIYEILKPKPDIWILHFRYRADGIEHEGRVHVKPTPWVRAIRVGKRTSILISNASVLKALPRALFDSAPDSSA